MAEPIGVEPQLSDLEKEALKVCIDLATIENIIGDFGIYSITLNKETLANYLGMLKTAAQKAESFLTKNKSHELSKYISFELYRVKFIERTITGMYLDIAMDNITKA